ncbi:MAG: ribonuclease III [Candidatus Aminicenantes bacterium]|nr:ribonuclease III [Candidatus Aminicenantes bacterium]
MELKEVEKKLGYSFKNPELLLQALTHSSYAHEHSAEKTKDNEILEFLGDAVVGLVLSDYLRLNYPDLSEGQLSKLRSAIVSTNSLSSLAKKLKLDKYIRLGKGEEKNGGRKKKSILADTFEAIMGAVYIDSCYETARTVLQNIVKKHFKKLPKNSFLINNFKSALQEYFNQRNLPTPVYRTVTEKGPEHEKLFTVEVSTGDKVLARAQGHSKKSAEQKAAQKALKKLLKKKVTMINEEAFFLDKEKVEEKI